MLEARRRDLAEARKSRELRRKGETLLAYLKLVPPRAATVELPDPHDPDTRVSVELDPRLNAQGNAARYFKLAARAERGLGEIPSRITAAERELERLDREIERIERLIPTTDSGDEAARARLDEEVDRAVALIPAGLHATYGIRPRPSAKTGGPSGRHEERIPGRLQPRRITTAEGWDVLIGRSNEGNDYLTLHLARPEDYWFHVHGAAGSHVVLRRGKGKNEPSRQTIEEVAAWAAFHSRARTAGKVPVIVTRKKYVRKPRGAKPGTVTCEREKTVMVRPREPERGRESSTAD